MTAIADLDELERLVHRSRLIGANPELVVHGGGNTSSKILERDHFGRERWVLRIKSSGTDLATISADGFSGLFLDELLPLRERDAMSDEEMVEYLSHCMVDPSARRPSIETLLHAFLPARHVDHVHADAVCALTNGPRADTAVREALGEDVALVPYQRPGFDLARRVAELADRRAVVLANHGLVTWGETHEESYDSTVELVDRAKAYLAERAKPPRDAPVKALEGDRLEDLLLTLRGRLCQARRRVLHIDRSQRALADRTDVDKLAAGGRATPDHVLRIGSRTAVIRSPESAASAVDAFEAAYRDYFERNRGRAPDNVAMRAPLPTVALVPGLGCVAAGNSARAARANAEIAFHSHQAAASVLDSFGEIRWLSEDDVFDFDYWPLELYKLSLAPPEPELAGLVVLVTGAASGIGRATALDLAARGSNVVLGDRDGHGLSETAGQILDEQAVCVPGDLTEEDVVDRLVRTAVESFGGIDGVVLNAGIAVTGRVEDLSIDQWRQSFEANSTAYFLLTRRVWRVFERQGLGGSLVYVVSKNAFAPGAGFGAYSAAKAAELQLARIAALEGGPIGVRANVVNPDAVFRGSRLWSDELRRERAAAHGIAPQDLEEFYAARNLLGIQVSGEDVAEAIAFLLSDRSRATTGCVITVDGGVASAFPR